MPRPGKLLQYTDNQMQNAMEAVVSGKFTKKKASEVYNVPRTTLTDKLLGHSPKERRIGHPTVLTTKEETELIE